MEDLGLDFTVTDSVLGAAKTVDLVPGGSAITVNGVRTCTIGTAGGV